jgi:hypothetical protein
MASLKRELEYRAILEKDANVARLQKSSGKISSEGGSSRQFSLRMPTPLDESVKLVEKWCAGLLSERSVKKIATLVLKLSGGIKLSHPTSSFAKSWDVRARTLSR